MRLAALKPDGLGIVVDNSVVEVADALTRDGLLPAGAQMMDLIERYDTIANRLQQAVAAGQKASLDPRRLRAPVARPPKLWCAAGNYQRESSGLGEARGRGGASDMPLGELLEAVFLKPSTAVISYLSQVCTLEPGDLSATGNPDHPDFQVALKPGDRMRAEIERIGALHVGVAAA
jgi:2-keto-4-pentenoate hydratase/2-oxohepta-3-ene-1,7-dioic acid hydratase in catechol pathway